MRDIAQSAYSRKLILPLLIFLAVLAARIGGLHSSFVLRDTGIESIAVGHSIATSGHFADPFLVLNTGPTAHLAPAFPALVGIVIKYFGDGTNGTYVLSAINMVIVALQLALLPLLTIRMRLGELTGVVAALCLLIGAYEKVFSEPNYLGLLFILLAFLMFDFQVEAVTLTRLLAFACLWGIALVVSPACLFVLLAWLGWLVFARKISGPKVIIPLLLPFLITAPWIFRNYAVFHRLIFIRNNLGTELALSFNPCVTYAFDSLLERPLACPGFTHPNLDSKEANMVLALGEAEFNRQKLRLGVQEIVSAPMHSLGLVSRRFLAFWFPPQSGEGDRYTGMLLMNTFTLLSIPGLWMMWKRNRAAANVLLSWLIFFPPIYYIIVFSGRFRYPIAWATFIPGSYFLIHLLSRPGSSQKAADPEDAVISVSAHR